MSEMRLMEEGLPRPWLLAGQGARMHFTQRAAGQRSVTRGGDLFRGRFEALRVVEWWTRAAVCPGVPLVVTAQPGAGKSAVVARALLAAEQAGLGDGVGFHARDAVVGDFVDAVAAACGLDSPGSWKELVQALAGFTSRSPLVVVVDALDEAVGNDIAELRLALRDLARIDWARVVVATRPLATGDPYRPGGHLHGLGVTHGPASRNLVDLDTDRYFAPGDLRAYTATLLSETGFAHPGPPGGAWETYRRDPDLCSRLAALVAERAGRNYLVAGMAAFQLAEDDAVVDPASPAFDVAAVPSGVGEALAKHLARLPELRRRRELDLLTALAYGHGAGLADQHWLSFTKALGRESVTSDHVDQLRDSPASDYLLETTVDDAGGRVTRLFHQALADELRARRTPHGDERRLVAVLHDESPTGSWLDVSSYARRHAPSHAAGAGALDGVLGEADFLAGMLPSGMRAVLPGVTPRSRSDPAAIYDLALPFLGDDEADQGRNTATLELISHAQGNRALADALAALDVDRPWRATGNVRPLDTALARFDAHTDVVVGVASLAWPGFDHPVVVTASYDETARVWDPRRPDRELVCFEGHTDKVSGVGVLGWPGLDHPVVVTTSFDATARVWDPQRPDVELARFEGHTGPVFGVACLDWPGLDHPVVVTSSFDRTARVWDPQRPDVELARFDGHSDVVGSVASLTWPGYDHLVVVTTSLDGTARVWDPEEPETELARFDGHTNWVGGVTSLTWPGLDHPVVVTASSDVTGRVWDPQQPDRELARFDAHTNWVAAVANLEWTGLDHPVVVTTSVDGSARVWDPQQPDKELASFDGHTGPVVGVTSLTWPGLDHPVVVTASFDGTARVWDPQQHNELVPFDGHTDTVLGVAGLDWPCFEHAAVVTASYDGTARVWDPQRPDVELGRFDAHSDRVSGAASLSWPGYDHPVVVTTSSDGTARVWDPQPGKELARFEGHTDEVWAVASLAWPGLDHLVVVTTSVDQTARVWDPRRPGMELARFDGHTDSVAAVATLDWPGLEHPVVATAALDGTARVWDPHRPDRELARFAGHTNWVVGVATLDWPGLDHPVVATASVDGSARVWDPQQPATELARFDAHTDRVSDVAVLDWPGLDHPVVASASVDGTARVWDPQRPGAELARLPVFGTGYGIATVGPSTLAVATARGFVVLQLSPVPATGAGRSAGGSRARRSSVPYIEYRVAEAKLVVVERDRRTEIPHLGPNRHKLVRYMASRNAANGGTPVACTREELIVAVWGPPETWSLPTAYTTENLRDLVFELRRQLRPHDHLVETIPGIGYLLRTQP